VFIEGVAILTGVITGALPRFGTATPLPWLSRQNHANKGRAYAAGKIARGTFS